jgi:hypothetical protein
MTKYKAGDKVTIVLGEVDSEKMNKGAIFSGILNGQIIAHEPAPEPVVMCVNVYHNDIGLSHTLEDADRYAQKDKIGRIIITTTGNDFTVEKCDE